MTDEGQPTQHLALSTQHSVYLSLGSNLGDRAANLAAALRGLEKAGLAVRRCSPLYETEPVGVRAQPWFLNLVVEGETALSPSALLAAAKAVERAVGRTPGRRWGPRVVDVDILLYDDWQVAETVRALRAGDAVIRGVPSSLLATPAPGPTG